MWPLLLFSGCFFTRFERDACTDNASCRDAFGWGYVCGDDQLCEPISATNRCSNTWPEDLFSNRENYVDDLVIGVNYDTEAFGLELLSIRLASDLATDAGGLDGKEFAIIECTNVENSKLDDRTQEEANISVSVWLADQIGVPAIVGPATSSRTEAAYLAVESYGTMIISPSATSPALTDLDGLSSTDDDPGLLWRVVPPDSLQGVVIAEDMLLRGVSNAAVVYESGPYGEGLQEAFYDAFVLEGGSVALLPFSEGFERDEAINTVGYGGYDEVLFISSEKDDIVSFFFAASQIEQYLSMGIFLADGAYDVSIFEEVSSQASSLFPQVRGTRPKPEYGSIYTSFAASFAAAFEEDPGSSGYTAYAYDATWLVIYGAAWAHYQEDSISGVNIARGLRQISSGDPVEIRPTNWSTVKANFELGSSIDVTGATGSLDFDDETGETVAPIEVWGVEQFFGEITFTEIYTASG